LYRKKNPDGIIRSAGSGKLSFSCVVSLTTYGVSQMPLAAWAPGYRKHMAKKFRGLTLGHARPAAAAPLPPAHCEKTKLKTISNLCWSSE
jgi:hypothetical protein